MGAETLAQLVQRAARLQAADIDRAARDPLTRELPVDPVELAAWRERRLPLSPRAYRRLIVCEAAMWIARGEVAERLREAAKPCEPHGVARGECQRCHEASIEALDGWREERDRERAQNEAHERVRAAVAAHLDRPAPEPGEVLSDESVALLAGGCPEVRDAYLLGWRAGVRHDRAELVPDLIALVASVAAAAEQRGRRAGAAAVLRAQRRVALRKAGRL